MGYTGLYLKKVLKFLLMTLLISQFSHSVLSDSATPWIAALPGPSPNVELAQTHLHRVSDAIQPSHPLQTVTVYFFSVWILFLFLLWLPWLGLPKLCRINVAGVDILVLFLTSEEMLSVLHPWEWWLLWVCHIWNLSCWSRLPLRQLSGEILS